jgi:hypothetical protein
MAAGAGSGFLGPMTVVKQGNARPTFQRLADDRYTCVPPPGFEKDPAVTEAIHEFDPRAIPLWRIQRWRTPASQELNLVHHGLGRYFPVPRYLRKPLRVEMPMDARGPAPNMLDVIFEDDSTLQYKQGGPGEYMPWDWSVYAWCRFQYDKTTAEAWLRRAEMKAARLKRESEAIEAELEYRKKQIEPWLLKKSGEISEYDWKQYMEAVWGPNAKELRRKPKPFVDLGARSPRPDNSYLRVAPAKGVA